MQNLSSNCEEVDGDGMTAEDSRTADDRGGEDEEVPHPHHKKKGLLHFPHFNTHNILHPHAKKKVGPHS